MQRINRGIKSLGVLVTATGLLNRILDWTGTSPSGWIAWGLDAYRALFHWMIDSTVGRLFALLGYQVLDWGKDALVIYFAFGTAMVLTGEREGKVSLADRLTMLFMWPFLLLFLFFAGTRDSKEMIAANPENYFSMRGLHSGSEHPVGEKLLKFFVIDVTMVFCLAAIGVALHVIGVLG